MKVIAALSVLILLLLAPPAVSQVPDDKLIVPGQRIGKWTLEMTIDDLLRMNGPRQPMGEISGSREAIVRLEGPDVASADFWVHRWDLLRLRVFTIGRESHRVWGLQTSDPGYKTARGVSVDVPRAAVETAYGRPTALVPRLDTGQVLIYDELGLALSVPFNVLFVIVFRPGTAKERWKF